MKAVPTGEGKVRGPIFPIQGRRINYGKTPQGKAQPDDVPQKGKGFAMNGHIFLIVANHLPAPVRGDDLRPGKMPLGKRGFSGSRSPAQQNQTAGRQTEGDGHPSHSRTHMDWAWFFASPGIFVVPAVFNQKIKRPPPFRPPAQGRFSTDTLVSGAAFQSFVTG